MLTTTWHPCPRLSLLFIALSIYLPPPPPPPPWTEPFVLGVLTGPSNFHRSNVACFFSTIPFVIVGQALWVALLVLLILFI
ncbi:hypothetical protein K435DRAFT_837475 [Dendrothele bispora CBS 962.96]|uniref:Uncharacterized protein n=1 Tax=Dendrothele bispora (strain CBS 962.96) TaxID=1314807 RepID=A0A4S8MCG1_DENBC|nr:hypothetical protein K435DRAFT_837475 [Dendrothele bispora CBS 962.96]